MFLLTMVTSSSLNQTAWAGHLNNVQRAPPGQLGPTSLLQQGNEIHDNVACHRQVDAIGSSRLYWLPSMGEFPSRLSLKALSSCECHSGPASDRQKQIAKGHPRSQSKRSKGCAAACNSALQHGSPGQLPSHLSGNLSWLTQKKAATVYHSCAAKSTAAVWNTAFHPSCAKMQGGPAAAWGGKHSS